MQTAYNEAWDEIQAKRRQLFSDWYKYMLCTYPPENAEADHPKIAQIRFYIEHQALPELEKKIAAAGRLERPDPLSPPMEASADSREYSLARQIEQALAAVLNAIADQVKSADHVKTQPETKRSSARRCAPLLAAYRARRC